MNCCRETVEMAVPPGNRKGVGAEAYLNSTSQGQTPEDARKDGHIRGRSRPFVKFPGYSSVIHMPSQRFLCSSSTHGNSSQPMKDSPEYRTNSSLFFTIVPGLSSKNLS